MYWDLPVNDKIFHEICSLHDNDNASMCLQISELSLLSRSRPKSKSNLAVDDVAVPEDAFLTEYKDYSLQNTIAGIEGRLDKGELDTEEADVEDVLPSAAAEMGAGQLHIDVTLKYMPAHVCSEFTFLI